MKVLVSTNKTQGQRVNDFCWVPEGELVYWALECDTDRGNPDGSCGCIRSLAGIDSHKGTTTFEVIEMDITETEWIERVLRSENEAWGNIFSIDDIDIYLLDVALELPVGTVLEKRARQESEQPFRIRQQKDY